ncbi:hypothetical protein RP20_CCG012736 [Aedes albopictus]|nr:hypothetical protein RP20_CCG012736 [Aedes albopictus]
MKLFITLSAVLAVVAANGYGGGDHYVEHKHIPIVHSEHAQGNDAFKYSYQSGNGITVQEQGHVKNFGSKGHEANVAHGSYSYVDPHGETVSVSYVADENGFHAEGSHIPKAHPHGETVSVSYVADENGFHAEGSHIPKAPPLPKELVEAYAKVGSHPEAHHEEPASYKGY